MGAEVHEPPDCVNVSTAPASATEPSVAYGTPAAIVEPDTPSERPKLSLVENVGSAISLVSVLDTRGPVGRLNTYSADAALLFSRLGVAETIVWPSKATLEPSMSSSDASCTELGGLEGVTPRAGPLGEYVHLAGVALHAGGGAW